MATPAEILRLCLAEAGEDIESGLLAYEHILTNKLDIAISGDTDTDTDVALAQEVALAQDRSIGEKWQGPSGRWFKKRSDGRVVPTAAPGGTHPDQKWSKRKTTEKKRARRQSIRKAMESGRGIPVRIKARTLQEINRVIGKSARIGNKSTKNFKAKIRKLGDTREAQQAIALHRHIIKSVGQVADRLIERMARPVARQLADYAAKTYPKLKRISKDTLRAVFEYGLIRLPLVTTVDAPDLPFKEERKSIAAIARQIGKKIVAVGKKFGRLRPGIAPTAIAKFIWRHKIKIGLALLAFSSAQVILYTPEIYDTLVDIVNSDTAILLKDAVGSALSIVTRRITKLVSFIHGRSGITPFITTGVGAVLLSGQISRGIRRYGPSVVKFIAKSLWKTGVFIKNHPRTAIGTAAGAAVGAGAGAIPGLIIGAGALPGALIGAGVGALTGKVIADTDVEERRRIKQRIKDRRREEDRKLHRSLSNESQRNPGGYRFSTIEEMVMSLDQGIPFSTRDIGEKWQGPSGRWFTRRDDGRVVPFSKEDGGSGGAEKATDSKRKSIRKGKHAVEPTASNFRKIKNRIDSILDKLGDTPLGRPVRAVMRKLHEYTQKFAEFVKKRYGLKVAAAVLVSTEAFGWVAYLGLIYIHPAFAAMPGTYLLGVLPGLAVAETAYRMGLIGEDAQRVKEAKKLAKDPEQGEVIRRLAKKLDDKLARTSRKHLKGAGDGKSARGSSAMSIHFSLGTESNNNLTDASIVLAQIRAIGEKWQGPSGKWFTRRRSDGRVVPTAGPEDNSNGSDSRGRAGDPTRDRQPGERVARAAGRSAGETSNSARRDTGKPTDNETAGSAERRKLGLANRVKRRLSRFTDHFRSKGYRKVSALLEAVTEHINEVGVEQALAALGNSKSGRIKEVQYRSTAAFNERSRDVRFLREYLNSAGITLQGYRGKLDPKLPLITSAPVPTARKEARAGDIVPIPINLETKLEESKYIPGLESTEDLDRIVGSMSPVRQFTPQVIKKLDNKYGKGKWIVKSYGDESFAGFGIFFPERIAAIQQSAKETMWATARQLKERGYKLHRENSIATGIKGKDGIYRFGTNDFDRIGDVVVKRLAKIASVSALSENGATLPSGPVDSLRQDYGVILRQNESGKVVGITNANGEDIDFNTPQWRAYTKQADTDDEGAQTHEIDRAVAAVKNPAQQVRFMAQPAFQAVGVSEKDRAQGLTWETAREGRVHVTIGSKDGKASVIPFATLAGRNDELPVVFATDETRAMEAAAQEAVDALPDSERINRVFAPDVMKTEDGWRVVELNASAEQGASLWLEENPFVIDAYVSHVTNREPQHVKFIRRLLKDKYRAGHTPILGKPKPTVPAVARQPALSTDAEGHEHKGKGEGGGQFTGKGESGDSVLPPDKGKGSIRSPRPGVLGRMIREVKHTADHLTPEEIEVVKEYTAMDHIEMNKVLRAELDEDSIPDIFRQIGVLRGAINRAPVLDSPIVTYRGIKKPTVIDPEDEEDEAIYEEIKYKKMMEQIAEAARNGSELTMKGFVSSTLDPLIAHGFSVGNPDEPDSPLFNGPMMEIVGQHGLYVEPHSSAGLKEEHEFLYNDARRFKVLGIKPQRYKKGRKQDTIQLLQLT